MDWGLLKRNPRSPLGWSLRSELLIRNSPCMYLVLCAFNLALRFVWAATLFGVATSPGGGMFFLEAVEILRRTVWAVFRIEWEMVAKGHTRTLATGSDDDFEAEEMQLLGGGAAAERAE